MVPKTLSLAPWRVCLPLCLFLSSGSHVTPSRDVTTTQVNTMGTRRSRVCVLKHMTRKTLWKWLLPATLSLLTRLKSKFERLDSSSPCFFIFYHHVAETCCKQQMPASRIPAGPNCLHICSWERADLHLQPHRQKDSFYFFPPPLRTYIICKWYVVSFKKRNNKKKKHFNVKKFSTKEGLLIFNCAISLNSYH